MDALTMRIMGFGATSRLAQTQNFANFFCLGPADRYLAFFMVVNDEN